MFRCHWRKRLFTLLGGFAMLLSLPGRAWSQDVLGSKVNGLLAFDFSDHYITPRGLDVEDRGLIVQPLLLLFWKLHSSNSGAITDVTVTSGVWNSFHSRAASGPDPSRWAEIDPIFGLTIKLRHGLTIDAQTTAFYTPTRAYATTGNADVKLTYNDSIMKGFSINPYVDYWAELNHKATVMFNAATSKRGSYLTLGATPTVPLGGSGVTLSVPAYANFVSTDFYQRFDGSGGGSGLAVVSAAPKVSMPLKFLGVAFGAWTGYAGVSFYHFSNDGLLDGNQVLANPDRKTNLAQFRGGVSIFF
jgi:hypothetical protein